jgi:pimeloyl-ACP methyl ester carboxylesterase
MPVVIVGYSLGAIRARMYARDYPADVAGMVIVDHAIDLAGPVSKSEVTTAPKKLSDLDSRPELLSMTPVAMGLEDDPAFSKLPAKNRELHLWAAPAVAALQTDAIVTECFQNSDALRGTLGTKPLAVVSTTLPSPVYRELQAKLLALSKNSRHIVAENSGHGVIVDEPEVVVRAIRMVVDAVRSGPGSQLPDHKLPDHIR